MAMLSFALVAVSCSKDEETPDDTGSTYTLKYLTFEGSDFTSLIDAVEGGSSQLYAASEWTDDDNTYLQGSLNDSYGYAFYNGGVAISNYYLAVAEGVDWNNQLSIPCGTSGASGNNGSANFAVIYDGSYTGYVGVGVISFSDGKSRVIDHMYVTNTTYTASSATYGDGYASSLGETGWITATITGYDETETSVGSVDFSLAKDGEIIDEWTKFDLSSLGEVSKIEISVSSSDSGIPAYVAIDDIAVRF